MKKYGGELSFFVNLPPNETNANWRSWSADSNYQKYVNKFCTDVLSKITDGPKILSSDVYPFVQRQEMGDKHFLKSTWFAENCDMMIVYIKRDYGGAYKCYKHAQELGVPIMNIADNIKNNYGK